MLANIYYLLIICLVFWYFVHMRKVSEFARKHANKYCEKEGLQYISIARRSSRLKFNKRDGIHWFSVFDFEFSGDGESRYQGAVSLIGFKLESVNMPAYRIN